MEKTLYYEQSCINIEWSPTRARLFDFAAFFLNKALVEP